MAYIAADDKQNPNPNQASQGTPGASGAPAGGASGGSAVAGSDVGTSTQPQSVASSPNAGGWTNIQSYLMANQGNTGSADALNKQVGSSFDQDKQSLTDQSTQAKTSADSQVQGQVGTDAASQMIANMGNQYSYGGPQSQDYQDSKSKLQGTLSGQWSDPNYAPAMSGQTQQYGTSLQDQNSFNGMMQGIYNKAGVNSAGGLALQQQLDNSNPAVQNSRQSLLNQYGGLSSDYDLNNANGLAAQTRSAIQGDQTQFGNNQSALLGYLQGQGTSDKSSIDSAVNSINGTLQNGMGGYYHPLAVNQSGAPNTFWNTSASEPNGIQWVSGSANEGNVAGVNSQRNAYNSISDVLSGVPGSGYLAPIAQASSFFDPTQATFTASGVPTPTSVQQLVNQGILDSSVLSMLGHPQTQAQGIRE